MGNRPLCCSVDASSPISIASPNPSFPFPPLPLPSSSEDTLTESISTHIKMLEKNVLSKECELCEENCTRSHKKHTFVTMYCYYNILYMKGT